MRKLVTIRRLNFKREKARMRKDYFGKMQLK